MISRDIDEVIGLVRCVYFVDRGHPVTTINILRFCQIHAVLIIAGGLDTRRGGHVCGGGCVLGLGGAGCGPVSDPFLALVVGLVLGLINNGFTILNAEPVYRDLTTGLIILAAIGVSSAGTRAHYAT